MLTREDFSKATQRLYEYCQNNRLKQTVAVRYKTLFHLMHRSYYNEELTSLRPEFLASDIVEELYQEQDRYGGWGKLQ